MTAAQKLHGALLDRIEALEGKANDHDDRLVKVENKAKSHDGLHKQGKYKIKQRNIQQPQDLQDD